MEDRIGQLRRTLLFGALSQEDIRRVAELLKERSHRRRSTIYRQGQLDATFYIVVSGRLRVWLRDERGEETTLNYLQAGDSFGQNSLLTGERRDVTVEVEEDALLLHLEKGDFDRLLREYPSVGEALKLGAKVREPMLTRRFPWQREDEVLVALSLKHVYAFVKGLWLLIFPLLALGGILVLALIIDWTDISLYVVCTVIGVMAFLLGIWLFFDWRNDYYVVTNKRVVHVEKIILLRETRQEAPLESIQDVSILIPSTMARLVGFSDLSIQTAGPGGRILFKTLGNAAWVRDRIFEQLQRVRAEEETEDREAIRRTLGLELGQVGQELPPVTRPEEVPVIAEPQEPLLLDLLRRFRSYLVPRTRVEEDGVVTWRKHWFRLLYKMAFPLFFLLILSQLAAASVLELLPYLSGRQFHFCGVLLFGFLVGFFFLWYRYEDWRNDIYQLTDERIIDINRLPLGLREERREASLAMIQDIRYEIPGIVANLLDIGNVVIETAAREAVFTFDWVHHPRGVQEEIFARMDALRERERQQERERRAAQLLDWFATYTDLTGEQEGPEKKGGE